MKAIVDEAKVLGYRGLGLTDHGNMAGSVELYRECVKAGIKPFPGSEFYIVADRTDKKAKRHHMCLVAYTTQGYRNLVAISTRSHRQFHNKPLLDLADLADLADKGQTQGIALLTGCYFGLVIQSLIKDGYEAAKKLVAAYASWFDTYVEIQAHDIEQEPMSETEIASALGQIATELDLPMIVTQDSHYVKLGDKQHHEALKRLVAYGPDSDDAVFPGDGFHLADDAWVARHHRADLYERGMAGLDRLLASHEMAIPEFDTYNYRVPSISVDPLKDVRERAMRMLVRRGLVGTRYLSRLDEELEVIEVARMAGYLLLVAEVCDHMREVQMFYQCRGSAGGSLICWLLEITNVDPLKWKLRFDRFLSKDRTKPPDIDIDIESDRRGELLEWISGRFAVVQIGTYGTYSIKGEEEGENAGKGSLRVKYLSRKRATTGEANWADATPEEITELETLSSLGLVSGYGVHAAGLIVCNSRDELESQVPLMYVASSKTFVSQYAMNDVEGIGLVKLDVLGVKTLAVLRRTLLNMGRDPQEGLDWIPMSDSRTYRMIGSGDTAGVFQLEGGTSSRQIKRLHPTKIGDVIAAMALYRPGVMASGAMDSYIARKAKEESTPARHPIIAKATKETFGILLYQDQVIEVLRDLGMGADDLTAFLKAVKASNKKVGAAQEVMEHYDPIVHEMCEQAGMGPEDVDWLWAALEAFAEYSFNRAHATIYGITAYRCAYLITHHPVEFHAALLAVAAGTTKEADYVKVTRWRNVRLLKPDVNGSKATYAVDPKGRGVRKGLLSIHGIGPSVAKEIEAKQPFTDMDDFAARCNPRIVSGLNDYNATKSTEESLGKLEILIDSGALDSLIGG